MQKSFLNKIWSLWQVKEEYRLKVTLLSLTFLFMSACQAIWRPLKNSIFAKIVGAEYVPDAKIYSLLFLIPLVIIYSKLVDWLRRHQLLYCFTIFHAVGGIFLYFLLSHPVYGIANTNTSPDRYTGWALYFFMESFAAFLSMSFWSFVDSINNPKDAKNYYGLFVAGSKIGCMATAGILYLATTIVPTPNDAAVLPSFILIGSLLLICAAICIYFLMKKVPGYYMHGYEEAYKIEKIKEKENKKKQFNLKEMLKKPIEGLLIMIKNPYVLGIFALVLFYEITIVIFDYRVLRIVDVAYESAGQLTAFYAAYYFMMNLVGLFITLFGTTPILRLLGIRTSLFVFPIISIIILISTILYPTPFVLYIALVGLRSLNYALNHPTREVLYIPTTKAIKFKAKAWTDAFGGRIAKGVGSGVNKLVEKFIPSIALISSLVLSLGLLTGWLIVVFFLGKILQDAINNKQVIGSSEQENV